MQPTIPEATNITCENEAGTQFSAEISGKRWSGITTDREVIPARQVEVIKKVTDPETMEVTEVTEMVDVPERTVWANRMGESVQKAIDEGAEVEPFVEHVDTPAEKLAQTDAKLIALSARIIEDDFKAKNDAGEIFDGDTNNAIRALITERESLRGQL